MLVQKTVFICYRHANIYMARSVSYELEQHGFDVFLDYKSIDAGDWRKSIRAHIEARAHFLVVLTPSALERCVNPDDILRMEIEHAIDHKRNIIPLMFEGFSFEIARPYFSPKMHILPDYNALSVPDMYFEDAMERLRSRFLNVPLETVPHPDLPQPVSDPASAVIEQPEAELVQAETWFERGIAKYHMARAHDSIADFTRAIELNPSYAEAYYRRGNAYQVMRQFPQAVADWERAIAHAPDDPRVPIFRSRIYRVQNQFQQALAAADQAIARTPDNAEAYLNRGGIHQDAKRYKAAIGDFTKAVELNPQYSFAYNNRGNAHANLGDFDAAQADYDTAIRLNPGFTNAHFNRARLAARAGRTDDAMSDLNLVIEAVPTHAHALAWRAELRHKMGDSSGAQADMAAALALAPDDDVVLKRSRRMIKPDA